MLHLQIVGMLYGDNGFYDIKKYTILNIFFIQILYDL